MKMTLARFGWSTIMSLLKGGTCQEGGHGNMIRPPPQIRANLATVCLLTKIPATIVPNIARVCPRGPKIP